MDPRTNFYFYFPDKPGAHRAAAELRERGFDVEVQLGADETNWLAVARKEISDSELDEIDESFEELGPELGGEYDGYDRP